MQKLSTYYTYTHDTMQRIEVGVNLELETVSDTRMLQTLLWLFIPCGTIQKEQLTPLKEMLSEELLHHLHAEFAGFRIVDTWLELYFYAPSAKKFEPVVASLLAEQYPYEIGSYKDAKQKFYADELYPDMKQQLQIHNNDVIMQLREAGDQSSCTREVEHYLFFPTQSNAKRALRKAVELQFTCKNEYIDDTRELRYIITLTKSHSIESAHIHAITEALFDIALEEHGIYEGWSTTLVEKNSL